MPFSGGQQGKFQPLKKRAWAIHARRVELPANDAAAERAWYEAELFEATGHTSTRDCNKTRDYDAAMAHFEAIIGDSIYWQMKRVKGDATRILHEIRAIAEEFDCEESYMRGIASKAAGFQVTDLGQLDADLLLVILRALKIQVRRQRAANVPTDQPRHTREEDPF